MDKQIDWTAAAEEVVAGTETSAERPDVLADINRVLARMPYLPNVHRGGGVSSPEELVGVLDNFAEWLRQYAAEMNAQTKELWGLKSDLAAVRRVFTEEG